jgi:hypothetical protein
MEGTQEIGDMGNWEEVEQQCVGAYTCGRLGGGPSDAG